MPTVNFYPGGGRAALGGKTNRIPYIATKPGQINTPASTRLNFGVEMIEALMDKREADKEKGIRSDMLAAMLGDKYQHDPNKASESFTPSEYIESQRVALADAQAQAQPEDALFEGAFVDNIGRPNPKQWTPLETEIDRGVDALGLGPADPADDAAMRAALIGDIKTPLGYAGDRGGLPASTEAEELAAWAGSPEEMAAQERDYKATVNTPDAVAARMAELVASNPEIANHPAYQEWAMSHLAEQQRLRTESTARDRAVGVLEEGRAYAERISETEHERDIAIEEAKKDPYTGPFEGTSMDAQRSNILLTGNPSTPEYLAAYVGMAEPKVIVDPATGRTTTVKPDMSPYRVPDRMQSGELENVYGDRGSVQETSETRIDPQIKKTIDATITDSASLINSLISYRDAFTSASTWEGVKSILNFSTPEGQAWTNAGVMAKGDALFDLGVLAGEDLALIRKAFPDPSKVLGQLTPDKEVRDAVDRVINIIQDKISAKQKIHNLPVTDIRAFSGELRGIRTEQETQRAAQTNKKIIDGLVGEDKEAYDWALVPKNRSTPQATKILKGLGIN